ncbi:MAG: exopolysaccharide biosynthesis polyprenyl glycosylphosphotransferase [Pedosphaera sp.]|nr:exopolysaccharide biosynthesis polyprenyl glycosylphosphotransferase [Pedosphaera sp.]
MLRRHRQIKMQIQQLLDAIIFAFSFWFAWQLRADAEIIAWLGLEAVSPFQAFFLLYIALIPGGPLVLEAQGFYDRPLLAPRRSTAWPLFKGCFFTAIGLILFLFFFRLDLARSVTVLFGFISFVLIFAKEEILRFGLRSKFARTQFERRFILVGTGEETARMRQQLRARPEDGMVVLAELDLNVKSVEELSHLLHEHSVNGVILNARHNYFEQVENAIKTCELEGVEVWLIADFFKTQISHTSFDDFQGRPVMVFSTTPGASWQSVIKQVFDVVVAFVAVVVGSPVFVIIGSLIKLNSPGPILFRQQRCGLNGQPFTILKFRTMETNAEQRQAELAAMNEMSGPVFKITNDPRITSIGRFLRKFSLDELPQLFNVLRGEMSMVGPRPLPVDEVKRFDDFAHRRRLSVKPGLTCLWQISGRNNVSDFRDWVRLDLEYIDNWSLWLDVKILWRTIPIVLIGTGAR